MQVERVNALDRLRVGCPKDWVAADVKQNVCRTRTD